MSSDLDTLLHYLQSENLPERQRAEIELISIGNDEVIDALAPLLALEDAASKAAYIITTIGTDKAIDTLIAYSHVSISAVLHLSIIGHAKAVKSVSQAALRVDWYKFLLNHHLVVHFLIRHDEIAPIIKAFYQDAFDFHFIMRLAQLLPEYDDERFIDGLEKWSSHKLVGIKMIYVLRQMSSPRAKEIVQNWYSRKGMRYS
jgi:hypothetical protein